MSRSSAAALVCLVALFGACTDGEPASEIGEPATRPLPRADTGGRSRLVQLQIAEREGWHRRLLARTDLSRQRQADAFGELANLHFAHDFSELARAGYRQAASLAPADPRWPYYLGQLERHLGRPSASAEHFAHALELQASADTDTDTAVVVATLVRLGEALIDLDRGEQARPHLERALELDPECAAAHFGLGRIAAAAKDPATAVKHFSAALALQPQATAVRHPLGLAYRELGRAELAAESLASAGGEDLVLRDPWMQTLHELEDGYRQAIERGREAMRQGRADEALAHLRAAVAADPLFSLPRLELVRALIDAGDAESARRHAELALELNPESGEAHFVIGYLDDQAGRLEAALVHYRRAVAADPEPAGARLNLARLLRHLGRFEEAEEEYRLHLDTAPQSRIGWLGAATSLVAAGRCGEARTTLGRGLTELPRDGALGQALSRLLAACPDPAARDGEGALEIARALADARADAAHLEAVAMALAELGRYAEAREWQRRAIAALAPESRLAEAAAANLARFEAGEPSRVPWPADGLELFGVHD